MALPPEHRTPRMEALEAIMGGRRPTSLCGSILAALRDEHTNGLP